MLVTVNDEGRAAASGAAVPALIETVYHREFGRLAALGTLLTGDRAAGEDLAQEVFERALRREARQPGHLREPAWPWLRVALVRLAGTRRTRCGCPPLVVHSGKHLFLGGRRVPAPFIDPYPAAGAHPLPGYSQAR